MARGDDNMLYGSHPIVKGRGAMRGFRSLAKGQVIEGEFPERSRALFYPGLDHEMISLSEEGGLRRGFLGSDDFQLIGSGIDGRILGETLSGIAVENQPGEGTIIFPDGGVIKSELPLDTHVVFITGDLLYLFTEDGSHYISRRQKGSLQDWHKHPSDKIGYYQMRENAFLFYEHSADEGEKARLKEVDRGNLVYMGDLPLDGVERFALASRGTVVYLDQDGFLNRYDFKDRGRRGVLFHPFDITGEDVVDFVADEEFLYLLGENGVLRVLDGKGREEDAYQLDIMAEEMRLSPDGGQLFLSDNRYYSVIGVRS